MAGLYYGRYAVLARASENRVRQTNEWAVADHVGRRTMPALQPLLDASGWPQGAASIPCVLGERVLGVEFDERGAIVGSVATDTLRGAVARVDERLANFDAAPTQPGWRAPPVDLQGFRGVGASYYLHAGEGVAVLVHGLDLPRAAAARLAKASGGVLMAFTGSSAAGQPWRSAGLGVEVARASAGAAPVAIGLERVHAALDAAVERALREGVRASAALASRHWDVEREDFARVLLVQRAAEGGGG